MPHTKNNPGSFDCYAAAHPDEPMFVLLGRDKHAAVLVMMWAAMRAMDGEEPAKIAEATACYDAMSEYLINERKVEPAGIRTAARALAALAEMNGVSLRIKPLANGVSGHSVSVEGKPEARKAVEAFRAMRGL